MTPQEKRQRCHALAAKAYVETLAAIPLEQIELTRRAVTALKTMYSEIGLTLDSYCAKYSQKVETATAAALKLIDAEGFEFNGLSWVIGSSNINLLMRGYAPEVAEIFDGFFDMFNRQRLALDEGLNDCARRVYGASDAYGLVARTIVSTTGADLDGLLAELEGGDQ